MQINSPEHAARLDYAIDKHLASWRKISWGVWGGVVIFAMLLGVLEEGHHLSRKGHLCVLLMTAVLIGGYYLRRQYLKAESKSAWESFVSTLGPEENRAAENRYQHEAKTLAADEERRTKAIRF